MNHDNKLIRTASRVVNDLEKRKGGRFIEMSNQVSALTDLLAQVNTASRGLQLCSAREWLLAAKHCCDSLHKLVNDISYRSASIKQLIDRPWEPIPTISSVFEELKQLSQEFDGFTIDMAAKTISVRTKPITLDDVYLGPFKIELQLRKLAERGTQSSYHCIALDPHPPAVNEEVTHPHVSCDSLCEGEGSAAIRTSLEQGRLCDFFTIVNSILNTYSPDSPFVSLDDWNGQGCYECGDTIFDDNSYYCNSCDNSFCEECSTYCRSCDGTICHNCELECGICKEPLCSGCIEKCAECARRCCQACLEDGICLKCKEKLETENEQQSDNITEQTEKPNTSTPQIKLAS